MSVIRSRLSSDRRRGTRSELKVIDTSGAVEATHENALKSRVSPNRFLGEPGTSFEDQR
jgi:hypothetical protein